MQRASEKESDARKVQIPVPSVEEQKRIINNLDTIQEFKKLLKKQEQLYKELFDSVLDRCMKGEI